MKKRLLLVFAALLGLAAAQAQTAITAYPSEQVFSSTTGTGDWTIASNSVNSGLTGFTLSNDAARAVSYTETQDHVTGSMLYSYYSADEWLISPLYSVSKTAMHVAVSYRATGLPSAPVHMQVYAVTSGSTISDFLAAEPLKDTSFYYDYAFKELDVDISSFYGQNVYIGVRYLEDETLSNASALSINRVRVYSQNTPVIALDHSYSLENVGTATTVAVNMLAGSTEGLVYSWTSNMMEDGTATYTLSDSEDSITLVHSAAGIDTLWAIVSNDYDTVTAYMVFEVVDFNAYDVTFDQAYSTGFEPGEDLDWVFFNKGENVWYIGGAVANSGTASLYITWDMGETNTYDTAGAAAVSTSFAVRAVNISEVGEYHVDFNWLGYAEWGYDDSRVYLTRSLGAGMPANMNAVPEGWLPISNPLAYKDDWQNYSNIFELDSSWLGTAYICIAWRNNDNNNSGMGSIQSTAIDNFTFGRVTCVSPIQFHATNIAATTADLQWTPRGTEGAWAYRIDDGEWDTVTSTSVSVSDLESGATHSATLRAICGDEASVEVSCTFRTDCELISSLPWVEDFENYVHSYSLSISDQNHCYTSGCQASSSTPYPIVYQPSNNWTGSKVIRMLNNNPGTYSYMILPPLEPAINTLEMSLDLTTGDGSRTSYLIVGVLSSTDFTYGSTTFDTIETITITNPGTWDLRNYVVNFSEYTGSGHYIMLLSTYDIPNNYGWVYVDNIDLHPAPTCVKPTDLTRTGATDVSLTVSWTSDAPQFLVSLRAAGGEGSWTTQTVTSNSITFNSLTPGSAYDVRVRAVCGPDDTSYAANGTFSTFCAVEDFPYAAHFTTTDCWLTLSKDNLSTDDWSISTSNGYALANNAGHNVVSNEYLISPTFNIPTDVNDLFSLIFRFRYPYAADYPGTNTIEVLLCVDGNPLNVNDYTPLMTLTDYYDSWTKFTANMSEYAGHAVNIAFHRTCGSAAAGRVYITDVELRDADAPEVIVCADTIANVGYPLTVTADLAEGDYTNLTYSWSSMQVEGGLAMVSYEGDNVARYTYSSVGIDTITVIAHNNYGYDTIVLPVRIRDVHVITTLPYQTGFESAADNALWLTDGDTNRWCMGGAVANGGTHSLYISSDGGAQNRYANNPGYDTSYAHLYRGIWLDSGEYIIDFDWRCGGTATSSDYPSFFRTYLLPAGTFIEGGTDLSIKHDEKYFIDISEYQLGAPTSGFYGSPTVWKNYIGNFVVTNPGLYILDFYWTSYMSVVNPAAAVDNLNIHKLTCPDPIDFTVLSTDATSATFRWFRGGDENQWEITVGDNAPVVVDTNVYTAEDLTPNTAYNVAIRAVCGVGDYSYALTGVFYTQCEYIADLPWSENFDSYAASSFETNIDCWVHLGGARQTISDDVSVSGSAMRIFRIALRDSTDFITVLPKFHPTVTALEMSLYIAPDNGHAGTLEVGYINNLSNIFDFTPLATYNADDSATFFTVSDSTFHFALKNVNFLSAPDGSRIAIRNRVGSDHAGSWYIDSVAVKVIDGVDPYACATPTDISATKLMQGIYQVNWTAGSELKWDIEITHNGQTEVRTIVNRPYNISQVQPDDHYYIRLKAICNLTAESEWSDVYDMNTATPVDTTPQPVDTTTGISNVLAGSFSLMPNPATSTVTVSVSHVEGPVMVAVIDMNGRKRGEWTVENGSLTIDLSNYTRGAYFVRVVANEGTAVRKLIVQ